MYRLPTPRGWRNAVEMVLFEISNSMKPYPSIFHAYTSNLRPVIVLYLFVANESRFRQPLNAIGG